MIEPVLRARVWIDGELVAENSISTRTEDAWPIHAELVSQAEKDGKPWLVQIDDPDQELPGLPLRFGSDTNGMVDPIQIDLRDLPEAPDDPRRWR